MDITTYNNLLRYLDTQLYPAGYNDSQQKHLKQQSKHFLQHNNILYKINRRKEPSNPLQVLKENKIEAIMKNMHKDSLFRYFEYNGTYQRIAVRY